MESLKYYEIEFIKSQILRDFEEYRGIDKVKCERLDLSRPWSKQPYVQELNGLWTRSIILSEVYDELDLGTSMVKKILSSLESKGILELNESFEGIFIYIREDNFNNLLKFKKDLATN